MVGIFIIGVDGVIGSINQFGDDQLKIVMVVQVVVVKGVVVSGIIGVV